MSAECQHFSRNEQSAVKRAYIRICVPKEWRKPMKTWVISACIACLSFGFVSPASAKVKILAMTTDLAWLAKQIGKDHVKVDSVLTGKEDPHHAVAKPSLILKASRAHLFLDIGMELGVGYVPLILRNSRNGNIQMGAPGFINTSIFVKRLEIPANVTRNSGDVHAQGNPHYWVDPVSFLAAGRAVLQGLIRADAAHAKTYQKNYKQLEKRIVVKLVGKILPQAVGTKKLLKLMRNYKLIPFLQSTKIGGRSIVRYLGGWLKKMLPLRGKTYISHHRQWVYFAKRFGIAPFGQLEPKPGIPPTAKHMLRLLARSKANKPTWIFVAGFLPLQAGRFFSKKAGIPLVQLPISTAKGTGHADYISLMDLMINKLHKAAKK
ncbi:MAG: hypothetical protein CL920_19965 [Deltaproteobacteria bacterium]|nr:hypothetical protein [Deltaproteobacteria bacterium]MBU50967.1 hypothetical protein [Deltaproteobacteria bacterium]